MGLCVYCRSLQFTGIKTYSDHVNLYNFYLYIVIKAPSKEINATRPTLLSTTVIHTKSAELANTLSLTCCLGIRILYYTQQCNSI